MEPHLLQLISDKVSLFIKPRTILEIGGGLGTLSDYLINNTESLTIIEKDDKLAFLLEKKYRAANKSVNIINKDVLDFNTAFFKQFEVIIGNIPYEISSPLLFKLWGENYYPNILLTVQKEFAQRLTAQYGTQDYSRLSVMAGIFSSPKILKIYPPSAFYPVPKVAHAVIWLKPPENENLIQIIKQFSSQFSMFMIYLFNRKNKRAVNSLDPFIKMEISTKPEYKSIVAQMRKEDLFNKRVKDLSPKECVQLFLDYKTISKGYNNYQNRLAEN